MNPGAGIVYTSHARRAMRKRKVTETQVEAVLAGYHTSYPAEPLPHTPLRSIVCIGAVDGRDLKVDVQEESNPPHVMTVV